jgi:hypothetical protein
VVPTFRFILFSYLISSTLPNVVFGDLLQVLNTAFVAGSGVVKNAGITANMATIPRGFEILIGSAVWRNREVVIS